jgi:hypothetical protein
MPNNPLPTLFMRPAGWLAFAIGSFVGLCAPIIYLMTGGHDIFFVPAWAAIAFYPGFFVAHEAYGWSYSERCGQTIGVLTVSLCYGIAAWIVHVVISRLKRPAADHT